MAHSISLVSYENLDEQVEALERDGYVYLPGVLSQEEIDSLCASMDKLEALPDQFDRHQLPEENGYLNKCINNTFNRDSQYLHLIDRPGVIEIEEAIHGQDCHVIGMTAWMTGPGRPEQSLHVDWQPISLPADVMTDPRVRLPVFITTAHYYLDNVTEELGPTQFVPGSHRAGRPPGGDTDWQGTVPHSILCSAGDVIIFRSEVWHRGSANQSDRTRYLVQVHYAMRMITQKFPPYMNQFRFDPDILSVANPRQRRLLGDHVQSSYD
jgi:ectoine hydroxylase-related dioxygenase (phytanoyl-CoA dioxygenase family)